MNIERNEYKNIDALIWKFQAFTDNVELKSNNIDHLRDYLHDFWYNSEFQNISHRAYEEIKQHHFNSDNSKVISFAIGRLTNIFNTLEELRIKNKFNHAKKMPQLVSYFDTMYELKEFILNIHKLGYDTKISRTKESLHNENSVARKPPIVNIETPSLSFENNFDNVKPEEVRNHFTKHLVDKKYLSLQELDRYLVAAFQEKEIPASLFKFKDSPRKQSIYTVFYSYFIEVAGKKHNRQSQYVDLLGKYFEGYKSETIRTNWSKEYKNKK